MVNKLICTALMCSFALDLSQAMDTSAQLGHSTMEESQKDQNLQFKEKYNKKLEKMRLFADQYYGGYDDLFPYFESLIKFVSPFSKDKILMQEINPSYEDFLKYLKKTAEERENLGEVKHQYVIGILVQAILFDPENIEEAMLKARQISATYDASNFSSTEEIVAHMMNIKQKNEPNSGTTNYETIKNLIINPIENYKGNKLLFCAGHFKPEKFQENARKGIYYNQTNEDWYTVDINQDMNPDYLADIFNPDTLNYLAQKTYSIVFPEYCPWKVNTEVNKHAAALLAPSGILVSKYCGHFKDLERFKAELISSGFKDVIFGEGGDYWMKYVSNPIIIKTFQQTERFEKYPKGMNGCDTGQTYNFVAIK